LRVLAGIDQPQGRCTFTPPPVVGTFATFNPERVGSATYVTLIDERDSKNYTVVQIGGRWIMGQNLNYQEGLTFYESHDLPSTTTVNLSEVNKSFWCPTVNNASYGRVNCNYWGALYTWETAMMADGKDGELTYVPQSGYCIDAPNTDACKENYGVEQSGTLNRNGRGICPPNWHVPTVYEWAVLFDNAESAGGQLHSNTAGDNAWTGVDAGNRLRQNCGQPYGTESPGWDSPGSDALLFRALASGHRSHAKFDMWNHMGKTCDWHSSSKSSPTQSVTFGLNGAAESEYNPYVHRFYSDYYPGYSVRCIRDE
jgi:uncharacterized protein (TIGR02145 family)